jgi:O-antigen/teichoic acid export membrane protein
MSLKIDSNKANKTSLRARAIRSSTWVLIGHITGQILRLGGNLILTRLLVPEMFGVMTIVFVIIMGLGLMSDFGLVPSIVQNRRGEEPRFLNVGWVVQIARGVILSILTLLAGWFLAIANGLGWLPGNSAYTNPMLPTVIFIMAIVPFIQGFVSTKLHLANRKLMLGKVTALDFTSQIAGLVVMIVWAWFDRTIWALVAGNIVTNIVKVILSHIILSGPSNQFEWDKEIFYELFHFGKWVFVSSTIGFLLNQGDRLLLGGLVSAQIMGVYAIAFYLATAAYDVLTKLGRSVFFPAMSEVARERPDKLSDVYYKIRLRIDAIALLLAGLLFETGDKLIDLLYDERYSNAGWMLQILSLSLIGVGFAMANQCFLALGRVKVLSLLTALQTAVLYITIPIAFSLFGLIGAIWAIALNPSVQVIGSIWYLKKFRLLKLHREFIMFPLFAVGMGTGLLINMLFKYYLNQ